VLLLALDRQQAVLALDVEVLAVDAGDLDGDAQGVLLVGDVELGRERALAEVAEPPVWRSCWGSSWSVAGRRSSTLHGRM
jgi:hypothetical protein